MMKSDNTMESNESTEVDRDRRNRELNEKKKFEMEINTEICGLDLKRKESRWDKLIFIDLEFYINGKEILLEINHFLFKEEFLWDRKINSPSEIKEFCCYLLRENTMSKEKCFGGYCEGINRFSFDFLESCAEYMTKKILEEIKIYEKFHPFECLKNGIFGSGCGVENEHLIDIDLDIVEDGLTFRDSFKWDIINEENIPETFAKIIVKESDLPSEFVNLISLNIRRQIKEHVFNTMSSLTEIFMNLKDNCYDKPLTNQKDLNQTNYGIVQDGLKIKYQIEEKKANTLPSTRTLFTTYNANASNYQKIKFNRPIIELNKINKIDNKLTQFVPFLFDYKLESQLGKKTARQSHNESKPDFLRNQIKKKEKKPKPNNPALKYIINRDHKEILMKNIDTVNSNEFVKVLNMNTIEISKEILKYSDYFDIITIDKNSIREFLSNTNI